MIWTQLQTNVPLPRQGRRFAALLIFMLLCMGTAVDLCDAREAGAKGVPPGVLKLAGNHLDYIELRAKDGHMEQITRPEETIELPPGEYLLGEVRLKGGYTRQRLGDIGRITVREGEQEILKVGGPLVPTVKAQRQGRVLRLSYELRGAGGETYTGGDRNKPPTFAIYKGQKQIASGAFEFG